MSFVCTATFFDGAWLLFHIVRQVSLLIFSMVLNHTHTDNVCGPAHNTNTWNFHMVLKREKLVL